MALSFLGASAAVFDAVVEAVDDVDVAVEVAEDGASASGDTVLRLRLFFLAPLSESAAISNATFIRR